MSDLTSRPLYFALLLPSLDTIKTRNEQRPGKNVFESWKHLDAVARHQTPDVGLRVDTTGQTPEESVAELMRRLTTEGRLS
jgi:chloramphenicol 3-O-phosphotransferase